MIRDGGPPSSKAQVDFRSYLDKTGSNGDGMIYYPSGNIAVVVCKQPVGHIITFLSDSKSSQVLGSFDAQGVGGVNHPSGRPWLVVTDEGYTISDSKGNVAERGKFPRSGVPVNMAVSDCLSVRFTSKQSIMASFSAGDCTREWQCGEALRRTEPPYTARAVSTGRGGKLELDVAAIRRRQATQGSVYVPPGPHHTETARTGLGSLRKSLAALGPGFNLASTVAELQSLDARLAQIGSGGGGGTQSGVLYGTARSASAGALLGASGGLRGGSGRLEDYGSPQLSSTQRRLASSIRSLQAGPPKYQGRRAKLPYMRLKDLDSQVYGAGARTDTIFVLCVLADWNPVCARVEARLEAAHGQLAREAAANGGCEAAHIKMYKVDASEGSTLQERYGFRTVPMFLMLYEGRLVFASNNISTEAEAREAAVAALTRGRRRDFLPEGFRFAAGRDNSLLEYIQPHTVLREL